MSSITLQRHKHIDLSYTNVPKNCEYFAWNSSKFIKDSPHKAAEQSILIKTHYNDLIEFCSNAHSPIQASISNALTQGKNKNKRNIKKTAIPFAEGLFAKWSAKSAWGGEWR